MRYNILAIDDDIQNLTSTRELLESWGYGVDTALNGSEALKILRESKKEYAVILVDYLMPDILGSKLAKQISEINHEAIIYMYSCDESREALRDTIQAGVVLDFIDKSEDLETLKDKLRKAVIRFESSTRTLKAEDLVTENQKLLAKIGMVGVSSGMAKVSALALKFRDMDDCVLITGETGTGKELIAKSLHDKSKGGFFAVNCAAFANSSLVEAELFGYEKGSFTGAMNRKVGIFEIADRGTVFLDELHHLSIASQAALLRAIRERKIRRVGSNEEIEIKCRIVAATKPDIQKRIQNNEFLADLYFRLKILMIEIPALRERKEDIPILVQHFCDEFNKKHNTKKTFLMQAVRAMEQYSWAGNVGELSATVINLLATSAKNTISPKDLDSQFPVVLTFAEDATTSWDEFRRKQNLEEQKFIEAALRTSKSKRQAAIRLGTSESTLRSAIERLQGRDMPYIK